MVKNYSKSIRRTQRRDVFSIHYTIVTASPEKLISFNLDGILEVFLELEENEKETISNTIKKIIGNLNDDERKKILIMIPNNAKNHLKI